MLSKSTPKTLVSMACFSFIAAIPTTSMATDLFEGLTDWEKYEISLGLGMDYAPKYEGSDESEIGVMPQLEIIWNDKVYFSNGGLGVNLYQGNGFSLSTSLGYDGGRDEGDHEDLKGLGDIDAALAIEAQLDYQFGPLVPYISATKYAGGSDGFTATLGVESVIPLALLTGAMSIDDMENMDEDAVPGPALMFGVSTDWADDNYMESYWGVSQKQATKSGYSQYNAGAGFKSVNVELGMMYPINENWALQAHVGYSKLLDDAADSPITKDEDQIFGGLMTVYTF